MKAQRVRTVQISSTLSPHFGGPAIGALNLWKAFAELGCEAAIVSTALKGNGRQVLSGDERSALRGGTDGRLEWLEPGWARRLEHGRGALRKISGLVRTADVVHIHGQYLWCHLITRIALQVWKRPFGVQPHGTLEPYQLRESKWKKRAYNLFVGGWLLRHADYLLVASSEEAGRIRHVEAHRLLVAPLGAKLVDARRPSDLEGLLGDTPRERCVVFLGRLARKKRPDEAIRCWAAADRPLGSTLVIAGPDSDWTARELVELADSLGVGGSVHVVGQVSGGAKTWLLERCGSFILPSENENFGVAVAEAMLAGCWCLVSDQVAAREHVLAASAGLAIEVSDGAGWVDGLSSALARSGQQVSDQQARAADYARRYLTWESVAERVLERVGLDPSGSRLPG